tara:strand:+ start:4072 stop:4572 length:501 start_codon:yes stop_codon:yes gene_type:complete
MKKLNRKNIRQIIISEVVEFLESSFYDESNSDILIDEKLERCVNMSSLIEDFCMFCKKNLNIKQPINIEIVENRENAGIKTTAFYNPDNHIIKVYGKNRAVVDVCRSIAHEMTHMAQMIEGRIKFPVQDTGGQIEDEANARAGELIKLFAKSRPKRSKIYESLRKR